MAQRYWVNGKLIDECGVDTTRSQSVPADEYLIPITDPALLYGATVFTTLRVYNRSLSHPLTSWSAHCDRIQQSLQFFHWPIPNWPQIEQGAAILAADYPVLRLAIFPDGKEMITGRNLPADLEQRQQQGVTAWMAEGKPYQRWLPEHKTGNYLPCWLARQTALAQGCQEAILVNQTGDWLETSTGNLWGWKDGCWWTPPLSAGILPGIVRSHLIHLLKATGQTVREEPWSAERTVEFEAVVYTNSIVQLMPIHTVLRNGQHQFYDPKHTAIKILRNLYVHGQSEKF